MSEFTPHLAPIAVLLFLGSVLLTGTSAMAFFYGALHMSRKIAALGIASVLAVPTAYLALLVAFSLASSERTLPPGGWKYFCEVDCHIGYSVAALQTVAAIGPELQPVPARGEFVIVGLKVWFDEHSISTTRGDGPLTPNPRRVVLVDDAGHSYWESPSGDAAFARAHGEQQPLTEPLRPGEAFTRQLVFDVPRDARGLRLLITEDDPQSHLLVGHENSPFHKKIYLGLGTAPAMSVGVSGLATHN
jgi:hypothetical protein